MVRLTTTGGSVVVVDEKTAQALPREYRPADQPKTTTARRAPAKSDK